MGRRFALMLIFALMVSGCKSAAPLPPPRPAQSEEPVPLVAEPGSGCLDRAPGGVYGAVLDRVVAQGTCATVVDSDDVWVTFRFPPGVPVDVARAALSVPGLLQPDVRVFAPGAWNDELRLELHFPPGQPGERLEVRLSGPVGEAGAPVDMGFLLERVPTPGVSLEWRPDGGGWQPLSKVANLPLAVAELRFRVQGQVPRAALESVLKASGIPGGDWSDDAVMVRKLSAPPPHLLLNFDRIRTDDRLWTAHSVWEIFFGVPPALVALDPATGTERPIGQAPLNAAESALSLDGRWVALFAVHPDNPYAEEAWAVETATGRLVRLGTESGWPFRQAFWREDELLLTNGGRVFHWRIGTDVAEPVSTRSAQYVAISPDGRYLAGFRYDWQRESKDGLAPGSIVLYDIAARRDRLAAVDQVKVRITHSEAPSHLRMQFSPDGKGLLIEEPIPGEGVPHRWVRLDLTGEELTAAEAPPPETAVTWLTGPSGYQVPVPAGQYTEVRVMAKDGSERSYGPGLVCGWLPDGELLLIRWENGKDLRRVWNGE